MTVSAEPAPSPRRGRPGYDQQTVLRRAVDLFNRQGYDATSIGDLARELGLTKSAIYHHVPSKEALLSAALDEALDGLSSALDSAHDDSPDASDAPDASVDGSVVGGGRSAHDRLRTAVEQSVRILATHLPAVTLLLRVRGNSPVEQAALERRRALDDRLGELVAAAVAEGSLRADLPPQLISRLVFGTVNSLTEWYRPDGPLDADLLARSVTAIVFDGLAVPPPTTD